MNKGDKVQRKYSKNVQIGIVMDVSAQFAFVRWVQQQPVKRILKDKLVIVERASQEDSINER